MYPRTEYEMTPGDLETILDACKPTPLMFLSGGTPMARSQQERANAAWARLGEKMGFNSDTVQPISGKGNRFFTAIPSETDEGRQERLAQEMEEKRREEIVRLSAEIAERQKRLATLTGAGRAALSEKDKTP